MSDLPVLCQRCKHPVHPGPCFPEQSIGMVPNSAQPNTLRWSDTWVRAYPAAHSMWELLVLTSDCLRSNPTQMDVIMTELRTKLMTDIERVDMQTAIQAAIDAYVKNTSVDPDTRRLDGVIRILEQYGSGGLQQRIWDKYQAWDRNALDAAIKEGI